MRKTTTILILLCLVFPYLFFGQGEASNWYFGNGAGISFNSDGTVTTKTDGKLTTFEGCATISDPAGHLLFYTDGVTVYNQNHEVMENGTSLHGDSSSTQSALIVPKPADPDIFYIITVDSKISLRDVDRGLNYTVVDISQNNGLGIVTEKNIPLLEDCSEKIAAVVKDCAEESIWIVTLSTETGEEGIFDTYHAFEINHNGISNTSIKSHFNRLSIEDPRGYLKISDDGTKMASANLTSGLYLYDFDTKTGQASGQRRILLKGSAIAPYGVEFSPNGRYLYVHASNEASVERGHMSTLMQFDLEAENIGESQIILDERPIYRGALQLGDNGKIYRSISTNFRRGTSYLGVINNPDNKGLLADYEHDAVFLGEGKAMQGLPPFIQSFFDKTELLSDSSGVKVSAGGACLGEELRLEAEDIPNATYLWTKDGNPFASPNRNIFEITSVAYSDAGKYRLEIISNDPLQCRVIGEALIEILPPPEASELFLTQCDIDSNPNDGFTQFDLYQIENEENHTIRFYESIQDRENDHPIENPENYTNTITSNQKIYYKLINKIGCEDAGEINLEVHPVTIGQSSFTPLMACDHAGDSNILEGIFDLEEVQKKGYPNQEISIYKDLEDISLKQNPLEGSFTSTNTTLYIRIEEEGQCLGVELLELVVNPLPTLQFESEYEVCSDGNPLSLEAPDGYDSYSWYSDNTDGVSELVKTKTISISKGGTYSLETGIVHENNGKVITCTTSVDFVVTQSNKAIFQEINISDASDNNSIEVFTSGDGDYEYSLNGNEYQESNSFQNVEAGFYTVFARDRKGCGISETEISVIGFPRFFTPNGDGNNDSWQITGINNNEIKGEVTIFDRYGNLMKQLRLNDTGWDGTYNGKALPASDYWFKVIFNNGKEHNGHFSLKR